MFAVSSIRLLIGQGDKVTLLCIKNTRLEKAAKELPVSTITLDSSSPGLKNLLKTINHLKNKKFDLIHSHFTKDLWLIVPALRILGDNVPLVITKHLGSHIVKKDVLHRIIYQRVDHAVAISNVIRDNLLDTTPLDTAKVSVIHNFVDLDKYRTHSNPAQIRKELKIDESVTVLGIVSRITPGKGHDDVIEAVSLLKDKNLNFKIVIVGSASADEIDYEEKLKERIRTLDLEKYFIFTGFRKDIPELLASFDIFLFPSRAEAFGLSLVEAMAAGLPAIACFSDGVKDIAVNDLTGLTYNRDDIKTLSENIYKLVSDSSLREKLAVGSYQQSERFSPAHFQTKMNGLYRSLRNKI